jgi:hypothetical protein
VPFVDVALEERPVRRVPVDVAFFDVDSLLLQITSGVAAGRSGGFPVEDGLEHVSILGCFGGDGHSTGLAAARVVAAACHHENAGTAEIFCRWFLL